MANVTTSNTLEETNNSTTAQDPVIKAPVAKSNPPAAGITDLGTLSADPAADPPGVGTTIGDGTTAYDRVFAGAGGRSGGSPSMPPAPGSADPYPNIINTLSELPADIAARRAQIKEQNQQARDDNQSEVDKSVPDGMATDPSKTALLNTARMQSSQLHMLLHNVGNIEHIAKDGIRAAALALMQTLHSLV